MWRRAKHLVTCYLPPRTLLVTMALRVAGAMLLNVASGWFAGGMANLLITFSHILLFMAVFGAFAHMEATFVAHLFVAFYRIRSFAQR